MNNSACLCKKTVARIALAALACVVACVVMWVAPPAAHAAVGDEFQAASGMNGSAVVESGTTVTYKVVAEPSAGQQGTVQVGGAAQSSAIDVAYTGSVVLPEAVEHGGATYEVMRIGQYAFKSTHLSSVTLPNTLRYIFGYAFYNCYDLEHVHFASDSHLESIGQYAFSLQQYEGHEDDGLKELTIPASVQNIYEDAFFCQSSLEELYFEGMSMNKIADYAFSTCRKLRFAEIPALTAEQKALGCRLFYNCRSLETVVFKGDIASASLTVENSSRNFENCANLKTVVYWGKKFLPTYKTPSESQAAIDFHAGNPDLYYTVTYYPAKEAAEQGTGKLGYARVRSDCVLADLQPGMPTQDDAGLVVYEGAVPPCPQGYTGWAYEGAPVLNAHIEDSLYAYPVDKMDFSYASLSLDGSAYDYTGRDVIPQVTVLNASSELLVADTDYTVSYLRQDEQGDYAATEDLSSPGAMRIVAEPAGMYSGQAVYADYTIEYAAADSLFTDDDGITYIIAEAAQPGQCGTALVGGGTVETHAIDIGRVGDVVVPQFACPAGSDVRYKVVGVSAYAFGAKTKEQACISVEQVVLPEGIVEVGEYAFANCTKLKTMSVPASVEMLGARAFQLCTSLANLEFLGSSIESIGAYCFTQCSSLTFAALPSLPKGSSLGSHAFENCVKLQRVLFKGSVHPTGIMQFSGCLRLTRVVFADELWQDGFDADTTTFYALVSFYPSKAAASAGTKPLGQAAVRLGTDVSRLRPSLSAPYVLDGFGTVPALPAGTQAWQLVASGTSITAPGSTYAVSAAGNSEKPGTPASATKKSVGGVVGKTYKVGSGKKAASYKVTSASKVMYAKAPNLKKVTIPASVKIKGKTYKVTAVKAKAFAKSKKCRTVVVKSKTMKSFKKAFKGSKVKTVKVPKAKKKAYKKLLTKKKCGKSVKVK